VARFIQVVVDGLANGSIYGSLALALVLIHRATSIPNFAQGEMAMFSTFIAWQLHDDGFPYLAAFAIALAISFVGGYLIERVVIRPVEGSSQLTLLIVTLGLFAIINSAAGLHWGYLLKAFPSPFPKTPIRAGGVVLSWQSVGVVLVLLAVLFAIYLLFTFTKLGLALRASAQNPTSARLAGINVGQMLAIGWGLSAAVGAAAGIMVAPRIFVEPNMMASILIYAFAGATLGGFDSPGGSVLGGLIVGVLENVTGTYVGFIGNQLSLTVALVVIMAVLLVRPSGIWGKPEVARV
jgi:branched-chain amino acid transport system permease protein